MILNPRGDKWRSFSKGSAVIVMKEPHPALRDTINALLTIAHADGAPMDMVARFYSAMYHVNGWYMQATGHRSAKFGKVIKKDALSQTFTVAFIDLINDYPDNETLHELQHTLEEGTENNFSYEYREWMFSHTEHVLDELTGTVHVVHQEDDSKFYITIDEEKFIVAPRNERIEPYVGRLVIAKREQDDERFNCIQDLIIPPLIAMVEDAELWGNMSSVAMAISTINKETPYAAGIIEATTEDEITIKSGKSKLILPIANIILQSEKPSDEIAAVPQD